MEIISPKGKKFTVGKKIGGTEHFNLYEGEFDGKPACILKIATDSKYNGLLDKEAYFLEEMRTEADELEKEFAKIKTDDTFLNYHFLFPHVIETFVSPEQGNRRIIMLSFADISKQLSDLTPLSFITERDHVAVDPRTSAWILGKLLKLLVFTHGQGILINTINSDNILINKKEHYVAIFDWSGATRTEKVIAEESANEISLITQEVLEILGGNPETGDLPADDQLVDNQYQDFLKRLINKEESKASDAHRTFYALIWSLWPRKFWNYTTKIIY
jgi:serine/threonine protein kinase